MFVRLSLSEDGSLLAELQVKPTHRKILRRGSWSMFVWVKKFDKLRNAGGDFNMNVDGILSFRGRLCVLVDVDLRHAILTEAHNSSYVMHPGINKMYWDLRELF